MLKNIKTREIVKDIKTLDKKSTMREALRDTSVRTKDTVQESAEPKSNTSHESPEGYAVDKIEQSGKDAVAKTADRTKDAVKRANDSRKQLRHAQKGTGQIGSKTQARQQAKHLTQQTGRKAAVQSKQATVKTTQRSVKQAAHTTKVAIKSTGRAAKTTIKTAETSADAARTAAKTAQITAKASARTAQLARVSAKTSMATLKAAARATAAFVKAAIAAVQSLVAAIAAGGSVAALVLVIICMVALLVCSVFGIFFSSDKNSSTGQSMSQVVGEINTEYTARIEKIKDDNPHDDVMLTGRRTQWKEVLAVYAVKTNMSDDNAMEVVTVDDERKEIMRTIFWEMNSLSFRVNDREVTEIVAVDDGNGNITEEQQTSTHRTLYIEQQGKTADEMAARYSFNDEQLGFLHELLLPKYDSLWSQVLYGVTSANGDIVEVAISQLGNAGGQPYWSWYGFGGRVEWCACFVSWCASECGYIDAGIIPKFSSCPTGVDWFKSAGRWQDKGNSPSPGAIIFFDWNADNVSDHVGIVEKCDGATVYTIEGNSGDAVNRSSYGINSGSIMGYGTLQN